MAAGVKITDDLLKLLEKRKLGNLLENFHRENVTVDVISKLSGREMECLGIRDRNIMMRLRLECLNFGSNPPPRQSSQA